MDALLKLVAPILLRYAIAGIGAFVVGHGWVASGDWTQIAAGGAAFFGALLTGLLKNGTVIGVLQKAQALDAVKAIAVSDTKLSATLGGKITTHDPAGSSMNLALGLPLLLLLVAPFLVPGLIVHLIALTLILVLLVAPMVRRRIARIRRFGVLAVAAALGGCSTVEGIESNLASPTTAAAAKNVETAVRAVSCGLSSVAAASLGIQQKLNAEGQTAATIVYVASNGACALLGGTARGAVSVPASSVLPVPGAA